VEEYQKIEEAKRQMRADKLNAEGENDEQDSDKDEDKYVDKVDMLGYSAINYSVGNPFQTTAILSDLYLFTSIDYVKVKF